MSDVISCADLMAEAQTEYRALTLKTRQGQEVRLRNLLMLPKDALHTARVILEAFEAGAPLEELEPKLRELLLLVADNSKALSREMQDWPLAMYVRTVTAWQEGTQVPEASGSSSS